MNTKAKGHEEAGGGGEKKEPPYMMLFTNVNTYTASEDNASCHLCRESDNGLISISPFSQSENVPNFSASFAIWISLGQ